jgi:hypothetical protein
MTASSERAWCYFRCLVQACYREARHVGPPGDEQATCEAKGEFAEAAMQCQRNRANLKGLQLWETTQGARTTVEVIGPYVAISGLTPERLPSLFALPTWQPRYGGLPWVRIAEVMLELKEAIEEADAPRAKSLCDVTRGLNHNSGPLVPEVERWQNDYWQRQKWPELCE